MIIIILKNVFVKELSYWLCLSGNIGITLLIFIAAYHEKSFTNFINALFYVTAFYTIIFLYLYIVQGKFFDGIVFSFRNFKQTIFSHSEFYERHKVKALPSENINHRVFHVFRWQCITMISVLLILQGVYFLI